MGAANVTSRVKYTVAGNNGSPCRIETLVTRCPVLRTWCQGYNARMQSLLVLSFASCTMKEILGPCVLVVSQIVRNVAVMTHMYTFRVQAGEQRNPGIITPCVTVAVSSQAVDLRQKGKLGRRAAEWVLLSKLASRWDYCKS